MSEDRKQNRSKAIALVEDAARKGAKIVCLPELFSMRYFPSEKRSRPIPETIPGPTTRDLSRAAKQHRVTLIGGSIFEKGRGRNYNTSVVVSEDGRILAKYRKVHLPQDERYYEQDYFAPGNRYCVVNAGRVKLGVLICFDQWYPEAARANRLLGAQILFYPTAIGWVKGIEQTEGDWRSAWEAVQVGHAVANSLVVCAVNRVGTEGETTFWGSSFVCDQFGKILLRASDKESAFVVDCDLGLQGIVEDGWGFLRNRRPDTYARVAE